MRTLTAQMLIEIAKTITDPVYLIKAEFGSSTYVYASTREAITYDSNDYDLTGAQVKGIDGTRLRFTLPNFDRYISGLVLADQIKGNEVVVYLHYNGEVIGRFSGLLDRPSVSADYNVVSFTCTSEYPAGRMWPFERLRPPDANHLPPAGTSMVIGPWEITLERDIG